jgi:hypothetical protein
MTEQQAEKLNIEKPREYFRVFSGKRNFAPHIESSHWYHIEGVALMNGAPNFPLEGDNIGVIETWSMPEPAELTPEDVNNIMKKVEGGEWREHVSAGKWVGKAIASVLGLDPEPNGQREQIQTLIKRLIQGRVLKLVPGKSDTRKDVMFVEVGEGIPVGAGKPNVFSPAAKRGK